MRKIDVARALVTEGKTFEAISVLHESIRDARNEGDFNAEGYSWELLQRCFVYEGQMDQAADCSPFIEKFFA